MLFVIPANVSVKRVNELYFFWLVGQYEPSIDRDVASIYDYIRCPSYLHTSKKRSCLSIVIENLSLSLVVGDLNVCV